jgi:Kelch motif
MERKNLRSLTLGVDKELNNEGVWKEITTQGTLPRRRSYHSAVTWRNTLFVLGGQDLREGALEGLWMLRIDHINPEAERWLRLKIQGGPPAISRHTAVVAENNMYVYGGTNTNVQYNTMYILDLEKMIWKKIESISDNDPPKMDSHSCVVYKSLLIFFGGYVNGYRSNRVTLFNYNTSAWDYKAVSGPCARSNHSATVFRTDMYVFGGFDEDHSTLNDFWTLNLKRWTWSNIPLRGDIPAARSGHCSLIYKDKLILFGGIKEIGHETNELFYCNLSNFEWVLIFHGEVSNNKTNLKNLIDKKSLISRKNSKILTDFAKFEEIKEKEAKSLKDNEKIISVPCARDGHSANLIDNKIYIFGGDKHQMSFNDLHVYSIGN